MFKSLLVFVSIFVCICLGDETMRCICGHILPPKWINCQTAKLCKAFIFVQNLYLYLFEYLVFTSFQCSVFFNVNLTCLEGANSWSLIKYKLNVFTPFNSRRGQQLYVLWLPELTGLTGLHRATGQMGFLFLKVCFISFSRAVSWHGRLEVRTVLWLTFWNEQQEQLKCFRFWCWGWDLWENVLVIPSGNYLLGKV